MSRVRGRAVTAWPSGTRYASRFTGLFSHFGELPRLAHDPDVAMWAGTIVPHGARHVPITAGGAGWTLEAARAACLGEAIERYQPYPLPHDARITATFARWPLDEPAVEPEGWTLFHPEQYARPDFPFQPFTRDTLCSWTRFRHASTGKAVWVPEELAFLYPRAGGSHHIGLSISTGLSCGRLGDPVLLRGLQETVERDALMGAWFGAYPLEEWSANAAAASIGERFIERVTRPNLRYRFFRVRSPLSEHVTIVTVEGPEREGFCFSAGAACRETRGASWNKSLLEAVQGRHYARYLRGLLREANSASDLPSDFSEHAVYYSLYPERLPETMFARAVEPEDHSGAPDEPFGRLVERLGPERPVLFRLMTPPAAAGTGDAWHVLKILVPGLQPLHGNHAYPFLGGRLWAPRGLAEWAAIPPHPFP